MHTVSLETTESLIKNKFEKAMTYDEFRAWVENLAAEGKTSGPEQTSSYIDYTQLNSRRMKRWDKTFKVPDALADMIRNIDKKVNWLVLTESWCGDAAPSIPVMNKIAEINPLIQLKIISRDENLELMERFRTNGSLSIPKLIAVEEASGQIFGDWGPRPSTARKMVEAYKEEHGKLTAEFREDLQRWYNANKGQEILKEILNLLALE